MNKKNSQTNLIEFGDTIARIRIPRSKESRQVILLLHGLTGDEDSMWIFESRLPKEAILIAPRGIYPTPWGGYGWANHDDRNWVLIEDFSPAFNVIQQALKSTIFQDKNIGNISFVGFSQGAALGFSFSILNPTIFQSAAGLSGFIPNDAANRIEGEPLNGLKIFVAHGTKDELVPVERARETVEILKSAGGKVTYCEDDVGHKLSAACFRGLEKFFLAGSK
jgi:phospholipase/carboxylesterase